MKLHKTEQSKSLFEEVEMHKQRQTLILVYCFTEPYSFYLIHTLSYVPQNLYSFFWDTLCTDINSCFLLQNPTHQVQPDLLRHQGTAMVLTVT